MKIELSLYVTLCLLNLYADGKWIGREIANEIPRHGSDPPPHSELVAMARYTLRNAGWASITTASALPAIEGLPFSNVKPIADGYIANSTGIPYFYMSPLDFTAKDLSENNRATVLVSLEDTRYCDVQQGDEDPRCTRLMLTGIMKEVQEGTPEYILAQGGLSERHPDITHFPADHDWVVAKLNIEQIAMVDYSGGTEYIPVKDYLAYNYTQTTATRRTKVVVNTVSSPYCKIVYDENQFPELLGSVVFKTTSSPFAYVELKVQFTPRSQMYSYQRSTVINTISKPHANVNLNKIYEPNMSIVFNTVSSPHSHIVLTLQVPT